MDLCHNPFAIRAFHPPTVLGPATILSFYTYCNQSLRKPLFAPTWNQVSVLSDVPLFCVYVTNDINVHMNLQNSFVQPYKNYQLKSSISSLGENGRPVAIYCLSPILMIAGTILLSSYRRYSLRARL